VETSDDATRVFADSAAHVLGPIASILLEENRHDGLEVYALNLERVFMHLTGRELRD
jgi:hypothetical protein